MGGGPVFPAVLVTRSVLVVGRLQEHGHSTPGKQENEVDQDTTPYCRYFHLYSRLYQDYSSDSAHREDEEDREEGKNVPDDTPNSTEREVGEDDRISGVEKTLSYGECGSEDEDVCADDEDVDGVEDEGVLAEYLAALFDDQCLFSLLGEETEGGYVGGDANQGTQNVYNTEKHVCHEVGFWVYVGDVESRC